MVHALEEIRRALVPNGILIDLRPMLDRWQVEVVSARETNVTGRVTDFPIGLADDEAANNSLTQAEKNGWYFRDKSEFFSYSYSWDTPSEMEDWIHEEWEGFIGLDAETKQATRSAWALGDADSRVSLQVKMLISRWRKADRQSAPQ